MSGCSLYRGLILASLSRELRPSEALDLARHVARCDRCRRERTRQETLERQLDSLPEVDVPAGFTRRVMARVRAVAPAATKLGACLLLACMGAVAASGSWFHGGPAGLVPHLRLQWGETWSSTLAGFGRALVVLFSEALAGRATPSGGGDSLPFGLMPGLPVILGAGLAALLVAVTLASCPLLRSRREPPRH